MRDFINVAKALADRNRVRALMCLQGGELCLCQLIELLGLAPSTVSRHMAVLHQAGLVRGRKEGHWIYYSLPAEDAPAHVRDAIRWVADAMCDDEQILDDALRLEVVRNMRKEELCAHYRK
jgi:DNA-binding transcriptional ArsR family regulator